MSFRVALEVLAFSGRAASVPAPVDHEQSETLLGERLLGLPFLAAGGERTVRENDVFPVPVRVDEQVAHADTSPFEVHGLGSHPRGGGGHVIPVGMRRSRSRQAPVRQWASDPRRSGPAPQHRLWPEVPQQTAAIEMESSAPDVASRAERIMRDLQAPSRRLKSRLPQAADDGQ